MALQYAHILILKPRKYVTSCSKGTLKIKDLEMGRWSCIIQVGPMWSHVSLLDGGRRVRVREGAVTKKQRSESAREI